MFEDPAAVAGLNHYTNLIDHKFHEDQMGGAPIGYEVRYLNYAPELWVHVVDRGVFERVQEFCKTLPLPNPLPPNPIKLFVVNDELSAGISDELVAKREVLKKRMLENRAKAVLAHPQ